MKLIDSITKHWPNFLFLLSVLLLVFSILNYALSELELLLIGNKANYGDITSLFLSIRILLVILGIYLLKLYYESPPMNSVLLELKNNDASGVSTTSARLRKRAKNAQLGGAAAFFGAICLIVVVVAFLESTIRATQTLEPLQSRIDKIGILIGDIDAATKDSGQVEWILPTLTVRNIDLVSKYKNSTGIMEEIVYGTNFRRFPSDKSQIETIMNKNNLSIEDVKKLYTDKLSTIRDKALHESVMLEKSILSRKDENTIVSKELIQSIATRFVAIIIVMYLTKTLIGLYRHNARLAAFYSSRADILDLANAFPGDMDTLKEILDPSGCQPEKPVGTASDQAVDLTKEILGKVGKISIKG